MIKFERSNEIEIFVNQNCDIAIMEKDLAFQEEKIIVFTIDQFAQILAMGDALISEARKCQNED